MLRLRSVRDIFELFEVSYNSQEILVFALNLKYISYISNANLGIVNKKMASSYFSYFLKIYLFCYLNLFNTFFIPLIKSKSSCFFYNFSMLERTSVIRLLNGVFYYDNVYQNCISWKIHYNLTVKTKFWFLKTIPFNFEVIENYLNSFDSLRFINSFNLEVNLVYHDFLFYLFIYLFVDLVRFKRCLIFNLNSLPT